MTEDRSRLLGVLERRPNLHRASESCRLFGIRCCLQTCPRPFPEVVHLDTRPLVEVDPRGLQLLLGLLRELG